METGYNSKRFEGKPLKQPLYSLEDVARCNKDLRGSSVYRVDDREQFADAMAEMVLLCNEALKRSQSVAPKRASKPLSLEYIADRLDVDDPIWGYLVRDEQSQLQGFIACTTFTNWQTTFRWDSMHESAFCYDHDELAQQMSKAERIFDRNGELSEALQTTVHGGDPWNEGIVWPRIAEISLLGALGCGKALVSLAIEQLETMRPNSSNNYDYVVLQATENSVSFYEAMGFTRVGAITEDEQFEEKQAKRQNNVDDDDETESESEDDDEAASSAAGRSEVVRSPVYTYVVEKAGETPLEIAQRLEVNVWDILFLNQHTYEGLSPRSWLRKDTRFFIPDAAAARADAKSNVRTKKDLENGESSRAPRWYIAKENDTPRMISRRFQVDCDEIVTANKERLPELQPLSRLKAGTRIKVSNFHMHDDKHVPYCHWTFPDDTFDSSEPSYMMARKLKRRKAKDSAETPWPATRISKYAAPPVSIYAPVQEPPKVGKPQKVALGEPVKPKRPPSAYADFCNEQRSVLKERLAGKPSPDWTKLLSMKWKQLTQKKKQFYQQKYEQNKQVYDEAMVQYKKDLVAFQKLQPPTEVPTTLFNQVVRLKPLAPGRQRPFSDVAYFYVLTYIPDLQWCHLAPMRKVGTWGDEAQGRPKWMLVDENEGKEVDISASFCVPVRSQAMRGTVDADEEEWDIMESQETAKRKGVANSDWSKKRRPTRSATKPLTGTVERKRKRRSPSDRTFVSVFESLPTSKKSKPSSPLSLEEQPRLRGVFRELPRRKAAPVYTGIFHDESPNSSRKKSEAHNWGNV